MPFERGVKGHLRSEHWLQGHDVEDERESRRKKSFVMASLQSLCVAGGAYKVYRRDAEGGAAFLQIAMVIEMFSIMRGDMVGASSSFASVGLSSLGCSLERGLSHLAAGWEQGLGALGAGFSGTFNQAGGAVAKKQRKLRRRIGWSVSTPCKHWPSSLRNFHYRNLSSIDDQPFSFSHHAAGSCA